MTQTPDSWPPPGPPSSSGDPAAPGPPPPGYPVPPGYPPSPAYPQPPYGYPTPPGYPPSGYPPGYPQQPYGPVPPGYPPPPPGYGSPPPPYYAPPYVWPQTAYGGRAGPAPGLIYATLGHRILAALIDAVIGTGVVFVWFFALGGVLISGAGNVLMGLLVAGTITTLVATWLGLNIWVPGHYGGTLGMRALTMTIRREADGSQIGYALAAGRFAMYTVIGFLPILGVIANLIVIGTDDRHQAIQDKVCSTVVVRRG